MIGSQQKGFQIADGDIPLTKPAPVSPVTAGICYMAMSPFSLPRFLTSYQGIVNLDLVMQAIDAVPMAHGDTYLAQYPVGRDP